ncbi:hypothetical protein CI102_797 [Trichoderma harzianum]|uniref:Ubiquitin-like protease family profile domain-containing protein n=1 Tax=Trichoderma harzianum CBS 226.95 TaxID=983964 RepID=A0A2T3ZYX5_TRIHA|nr:hypothetical protein M431DRAFT_534235 [Trichoderma harzianum CBS 226.95]PKK54503.1 hypothetical protein CI102_797 [Trichoderma harzianum]PTB50012.1 hypothetical protein M431DRAFT_534235 [Trichoderma harzianum CBS 226.95]
MALMLASAAISGVGLFVYRSSSRLHTACTNFLPDYEAQDSDDGISRKRRKVRRPEVLGNSEKTEPPIPTETYFDALESATEPPKEHEVNDNTSITYYKDEDTDFLDYLDMEAGGQEDMWPGPGPLVYNKAKPGPSPSVSSIGDIFEELGISAFDLNDGYEDDEPKITWIDDDNELNELARGLAQRYRSARAGKQPVVAPPAPKPDPAGRIEELMALPSVETLKISDESKAEVETLQAKAAETRLVDQQREKLAKERFLRDQALQKLKERTAKGPRQPVVAPLSDQWIEKIVNTIELSETDVVATTCQGTPLRRHDFATVVAAKTWLNDEIVNGALAELEKQINLVAGITDYKQQGRKCLVMNSFFWPRVKEAGGKKTQSILRRMGVTPKNLLLMDTILIPICQEYHWTLVVVQPKQRKVMHLDSFNRPSSHPNLALAWMSDYLGDLYHAKPWEVVVLKTPQQNNGYDCGVHVITNGVCLALGLDPLQSYNVGEMALQRLRIAGMLLNGGFVGDFDLWQQ